MTFETMTEAYPVLVATIAKTGERSCPRKFTCVERRPFYFEITNPAKSIYEGLSRRLNARFWAIETLSYLAGLGAEKWHAKLLCMSNVGMESFLNTETELFDGAYGIRIRRSLGDVIGLLRRDPDSRQAVVSIWSPGFLFVEHQGERVLSKDVPCTIALHFFRSRGKLCLQVNMRSNDLNWGTPYDVPAFCAILLYVANQVGMEAGSYHHVCGSLHIYENEQGEKGQPGPPNVPLIDEYESRSVPVVTSIEWIEPALKSIYEGREKGLKWKDCQAEMPAEWLAMIQFGTWCK